MSLSRGYELTSHTARATIYRFAMNNSDSFSSVCFLFDAELLSCHYHMHTNKNAHLRHAWQYLAKPTPAPTRSFFFVITSLKIVQFTKSLNWQDFSNRVSSTSLQLLCLSCLFFYAGLQMFVKQIKDKWMHRHCASHTFHSPLSIKNILAQESTQHRTYIKRLLQGAMKGKPKSWLETKDPFRRQDTPVAWKWRYQTFQNKINVFCEQILQGVRERHSLLFPAELSSKPVFWTWAFGKKVGIMSQLNNTTKVWLFCTRNRDAVMDCQE